MQAADKASMQLRIDADAADISGPSWWKWTNCITTHRTKKICKYTEYCPSLAEIEDRGQQNHVVKKA
jgi:hypothetical protein